jgi:hypothetical protein
MLSKTPGVFEIDEILSNQLLLIIRHTFLNFLLNKNNQFLFIII